MFECRCRVRVSPGFEVDVNFKSDARVIALFGPSGCGKTTLLDAIAGLRKPDEARIAVGGRVLTDTAAGIHLKPEQRRIGYAFQDLRLFPHLTVEENLRFGERKGRDAAALAFVAGNLSLTEFMQRKTDDLSGGERQRVALGRALMCRPELLLLDEPLSSLDDALKFHALQQLERIIGERDSPSIFVSHSQAEVRRLAQWVVVLQSGRVVAEGTPEKALAAPAPLAMTKEAEPMNLLRIEERREANGAAQGRIGMQWLTLPPAGGKAPMFISFPPGAVMLARHDVAEVSARNHMRATVVKTVEVGGVVFVEVDAGQLFWAAVTPAAAGELELMPGKPLLCLIKTQSLSVF